MKNASAKNGLATLVVLIVMVIITLTFVAMFSKISAHRQMKQQQLLKTQTLGFVHSGIALTKAKFAADPNYQGETWNIPAEESGLPLAATIQISILPVDDQHPTQADIEVIYGEGTAAQTVQTYRLKALYHAN